jgi:hypothetical protein
MGEVKTLILAHEHDAEHEFVKQPDEQISALWKTDRNIKIIGSMLAIHISTSPMADVSVCAELTLEPRISLDVYIGGEKSEPARVINFCFFNRQLLTSGAVHHPAPNIVMFPDGEYISVAKDTTIHLIDKASIPAQRGTTYGVIWYIEK